jgi:hypothetical protein
MSKVLLLLLPLLATPVLSIQQTLFEGSANQPRYYLDYSVDDQTDPANPEIFLQLSISNYDMSSMTA